MSALTKTIETFRTNLKTLEDFDAKYGDKIPGDLPVYICTYDDPPSVNVYVHNDKTRDRRLSAAGDLFGRDGWSRFIGHDRCFYDWRKTIDGVKINIYQAESAAHPSEGSPVFPNQFPLLLADAEKA